MFDWIYDWWNAKKLEDMRVGAAFLYLCLSGEMSSEELRLKLRSLWFGKRMGVVAWHAVMRRLAEEHGVLAEERWTNDGPYAKSLDKYYRVEGVP